MLHYLDARRSKRFFALIVLKNRPVFSALFYLKTNTDEPKENESTRQYASNRSSIL